MLSNAGRGLAWVTVLSVSLGVCAASGRAQSAAPSIEDEARSLLKVMNVETQYRQMQGVIVQQLKPALQGVAATLPEARRGAFNEKADQLLAAIAQGDPKELMEESVRVYARHYSIEELKGLRDFYSTLLGKKLLTETPNLTNEMLSATMQWNQGIANRLLGDLMKDFPELNSSPGAAQSAPPDPDQHQHH